MSMGVQFQYRRFQEEEIVWTTCTKRKWQAQVQCCSEGNDCTHTHTHTHTHTPHTNTYCMYVHTVHVVCMYTHTNRPHMKPVAYSNHAHTYMRMYTRTVHAATPAIHRVYAHKYIHA